ncbi:MAG: hypothetical protein LC808_03025 [Actinobacteria bacterium]|nr:hypothetical protein [Actinomycetota bacterium]
MLGDPSGTAGTGAVRHRAGPPGNTDRMANYYRYSVIDTVGAGTSEVQRNVLSRRGVGLPVEN